MLRASIYLCRQNLKFSTLGIEINMAHASVAQFDFCNKNHIKWGKHC